MGSQVHRRSFAPTTMMSAAPRLLDDKSGRKVLGATPFQSRRAVLHRRAELRFDLGNPTSDLGLTPVDHLLGLLTRSEVKRRAELAGDYSDRTALNRFANCPAISRQASFDRSAPDRPSPSHTSLFSPPNRWMQFD